MNSTNSLWHDLNSRAFIIAEVANVHEGDFRYAKDLIDCLSETNADAIKLQIYIGEERGRPGSADHTEFSRLAFEYGQWEELVGSALAQGLWVIADVFGETGLEWAERLKVHGLMIHASDVVNTPLIKKVASCSKPVMLSTGGATLTEVHGAMEATLKAGNEEIVLLHGFQGFPTKEEDSQLQRITALRHNWPFPVGFACHVDGDSPWASTLPLLALASGANVFEEHVTLDRARRLDDDHSALNFSELASLTRQIRDAVGIMGDDGWERSQAEFGYRNKFQKNLVASFDISAGTVLEEHSLSYQRVELESCPARLEDVRGRTTVAAIPAGEPVTFDKLDLKTVVLVAVRTGSSRLPQKALMEISGQTTLAHLLDRLKLVHIPDEVIVATSTSPGDDSIVSIAQQKGMKCFRGSEDDVLLRFIEAAEQQNADIVVRITADNILADPSYIDRAVRYHLENNFDFTTVEGLPDGLGCDVISLSTMKTAHDLGQATDHSEFMAWFLKRPDFFRTGAMDCDQAHFRPDYRLTLDFAEDFELFERIFETLYLPGKFISTDTLIEFLDEHPEIVKINEAAISRDLNVPETRERLGIGLRWPTINLANSISGNPDQ